MNDGKDLPGCLAKVGSLTGYLEIEPLLQVVFLWEGGVRQFS